MRKPAERKWESVVLLLENARAELADGDRNAALSFALVALHESQKYTSGANVREETSMGLTVRTIIEEDIVGPLEGGVAADFDSTIRALRRIARREAALGVVRSVQRESKPSLGRDAAIKTALQNLIRKLEP